MAIFHYHVFDAPIMGSPWNTGVTFGMEKPNCVATRWWKFDMFSRFETYMWVTDGHLPTAQSTLMHRASCSKN